MQFRDSAIWLYRQLTASSRLQLLDKLRAQSQLPIAALFYHRVADSQLTPWTICTDDFKRHLDWLQTNFDLVSLCEAQRRIESCDNDRFAVAITFDDGYQENVEHAIPELIQRQIPVTYFVTTDFIKSDQPFPHDLALGKHLPTNNWDELRDLQRLGIEIGSHTRSHCDVASIVNPEQLKHELLGSIQTIEAELGSVCRYFAFPYGQKKNLSQAAAALLRQHGIRGVCSAYGELNWPGNDPFHLRRFHGDPSLERLKNWLTLDRRHLHSSDFQLDEPPYNVPAAIQIGR